ncbi:MAG: hypothetical protein IKC74_04170 [Clostridia bacterium]|nr:hypothetical protein [Clostridia bacterium]
MNINLITDTELEKILLSSARGLPDSPSQRGLRPWQIKKALFEPVKLLASLLNDKFRFLYVGGENLVINEISFENIDSLFEKEVL